MFTKLKIISLLVCICFLASACSLSIQKAEDLGVFYSSDSGLTWQQRVFVQKGQKKDVTIASLEVYNFIFHPSDENILFASTSSGIYKSTDKGQHWTATQLQNNTYADFVLDPSTPTIQYAVFGGKILKSSNDGQAWAQIYVERPGIAITSMAINQNSTNIIFASTSAKGVLKSEDYGNTWTLVAELKDIIKKIIIAPENPSIMYGILTTNGFTKSTDGGMTWDEDIAKTLDTYTGAKVIKSFHIRPRTSGDIIATSNYGILRSTDGGDVWQPLPTVVPFKTLPINDAIINPSNVNEIFFCAGNTFYRSVDGGESWQTLKTLSTTQNIAIIRMNINNSADMYAGITKVTK